MFVLSALAIALMVFDKRADTFTQLRAALSMPLAPLQNIISWPIQVANQLEVAFSSHDKLLKENLDLRAEQLLLKAQMQRLMALETENNQLKALLRSSTEVQGKVLVARLLSIASEPFVNQVTIDKNSHDNLFVGQPVLDANGVMGQVIHVGPLSSKVLLINDPHSGVPVQITRNGVRAIAVGDAYTGKLRLANVPQTTDIRAGDVLITSGLGENYPEGYPVGQVLSVMNDPGLQFMTIIVEPSARLDRSREVLLVWPNKIVQYTPPVQEKPGSIKTKKS
jgi:rod shape-determining protein MreC